MPARPKSHTSSASRSRRAASSAVNGSPTGDFFALSARAASDEHNRVVRRSRAAAPRAPRASRASRALRASPAVAAPPVVAPVAPVSPVAAAPVIETAAVGLSSTLQRGGPSTKAATKPKAAKAKEVPVSFPAPGPGVLIYGSGQDSYVATFTQEAWADSRLALMDSEMSFNRLFLPCKIVSTPISYEACRKRKREEQEARDRAVKKPRKAKSTAEQTEEADELEQQRLAELGLLEDDEGEKGAYSTVALNPWQRAAPMKNEDLLGKMKECLGAWPLLNTPYIDHPAGTTPEQAQIRQCVAVWAQQELEGDEKVPNPFSAETLAGESRLQFANLGLDERSRKFLAELPEDVEEADVADITILEPVEFVFAPCANDECEVSVPASIVEASLASIVSASVSSFSASPVVVPASPAPVCSLSPVLASSLPHAAVPASPSSVSAVSIPVATFPAPDVPQELPVSFPSPVASPAPSSPAPVSPRSPSPDEMTLPSYELVDPELQTVAPPAAMEESTVVSPVASKQAATEAEGRQVEDWMEYITFDQYDVDVASVQEEMERALEAQFAAGSSTSVSASVAPAGQELAFTPEPRSSPLMGFTSTTNTQPFQSASPLPSAVKFLPTTDQNTILLEPLDAQNQRFVSPLDIVYDDEFLPTDFNDVGTPEFAARFDREFPNVLEHVLSAAVPRSIYGAFQSIEKQIRYPDLSAEPVWEPPTGFSPSPSPPPRFSGKI